MMNRYTGEPLFLDPKVEQYGPHMVMRNVSRPNRTSFITIDTRFGDDYTDTGFAVATNVSLIDRLCDAKTVRIVSAEIPMSFFNISSALGNNCFTISTSSGTEAIINIADGNYETTASIATAISTALSASTFSDLSCVVIDGYLQLTVSVSGTYTIAFDVDTTGATDKYNFKDKLGWILGFRTQSIEVVYGSPITAPALSCLQIMRYMYIVVDDFSGSARAAMPGAVSRALINRHILGRVVIDSTASPFGSVLCAHAARGTLVSDRREYIGKTDLQRFCVQLVSPSGTAINLNGLDFSFVLEIEHA